MHTKIRNFFELPLKSKKGCMGLVEPIDIVHYIIKDGTTKF